MKKEGPTLRLEAFVWNDCLALSLLQYINPGYIIILQGVLSIVHSFSDSDRLIAEKAARYARRHVAARYAFAKRKVVRPSK
jgi:hypothetical protein